MNTQLTADVYNRKIANNVALITVALLFSLTMFPEFAFAQDARAKLTSKAQDVFDILFEIAYWGCGIIAIASILGWMASKVEGSTLLKVLGGAVLLFSVTLLLDYAKA
jgi:hypothetical protein